ncbi:MAG: hypothetical protein FWB83_07825 [Treponema sp.]|nr:hypothetical protein [Treponema sp.]
MKKFIIFSLFLIISHTAFSQNDTQPVFIIEANAGYSIGINTDSAIQFDVKFIYPYHRFGIILEVGGFFIPDNITFHCFLGPMYKIIDNNKWRLPVALGLEFYQGKTLFYGIGGIISAHYLFSKHFYVGLNIGITYAFNNVYEEITGYRDASIGVDGSGNKVYPIGPGGAPILQTPIRERKDHYGNYFFIKPSFLIGVQL